MSDSESDFVNIRIKRRTAEYVRLMMPMPSLLNLAAISAGLEFGEAVDKALGRDVHADLEEEAPPYEPPR